MSRIFISYRRADSAGYVGRLYDRLTAAFGSEQIFMDVDTIGPGEDFVRAIEEAVSTCNVVLVVIGPQWLSMSNEYGQRRIDDSQDFVRLEVAAALRRNVPVIPLLVGGAAMPGANDLPPDLAPLTRRNAVTLDHRDFHHDVDTLIDALTRQFETGRQKPAASRPSRQTTTDQPISVSKRVINAIVIGILWGMVSADVFAGFAELDSSAYAFPLGLAIAFAAAGCFLIGMVLRGSALIDWRHSLMLAAVGGGAIILFGIMGLGDPLMALWGFAGLYPALIAWAVLRRNPALQFWRAAAVFAGWAAGHGVGFLSVAIFQENAMFKDFCGMDYRCEDLLSVALFTAIGGLVASLIMYTIVNQSRKQAGPA